MLPTIGGSSNRFEVLNQICHPCNNVECEFQQGGHQVNSVRSHSDQVCNTIYTQDLIGYTNVNTDGTDPSLEKCEPKFQRIQRHIRPHTGQDLLGKSVKNKQ